MVIAENAKPTMKDLNRHVVKQYASYWYNTGIELELEVQILNDIKKEFPEQNEFCFRTMLNKWLESAPTWKTLELALTNARRIELGLDPIDGELVRSFLFTIKSLLQYSVTQV